MGYNLANNALFVKNSAQISGLSTLPSILVPSDHADSDGNLKQSDIRLVLTKLPTPSSSYSMQPLACISKRYFRQLPAGNNVVHWDGRDDNGTFVAPGRTG